MIRFMIAIGIILNLSISAMAQFKSEISVVSVELDQDHYENRNASTISIGITSDTLTPAANNNVNLCSRMAQPSICHPNVKIAQSKCGAKLSQCTSGCDNGMGKNNATYRRCVNKCKASNKACQKN